MHPFFYIFILSLPFSFALNPVAGIDLPIVRALVPVLFLLWLGSCLKNKTLLIDSRPRFFLWLSFLFLAVFSYAWAIEQDRAMRKILFLLSFFPLYFISYSLSAIQEKILKTIFFSAAAAAIFGLAQFSLQFILGLDPTLKIFAKTISPFFLGQTFGKMVAEYPSWLVNVGGNTIMRAFGSFPDPHLFSLYLNLCLPLGIYLFSTTKKKIFLTLNGIILLASLLSFARAAYLALLIAAGFYLVFSPIGKFFQKKPALLFLTLLFFLSVLLTDNPVSKRLADSFNVKEGSNSGRILMWQKAWDATLNYPLTGVGIGNFSRYIEPSADYRVPIYAHNLFLDFSSETGILATGLLLLTLLSPILYFFYKPSALSKALAASFIILIIHSLFETPFYSVNVFPLVMILLAIKLT